MHTHKFITLIALLVLSLPSYAQLIYTEPFFPEVDDDVTVYFDASEGNMALAGFTGDVYVHAGVITSESTSPTDWRYVASDWGTTDADIRMTSLGNDLYKIEYNIRDFYSIPMGEEVLQLAFVFRDGAGSVVGRAADGSDIYTPVYDLNGSLETRFITPTGNFLAEMGNTLEILAAASVEADLSLYDNGQLLTQETGSSINYNLDINTTGSHLIEFIAVDGSIADTASISYLVPTTIPAANPPAGSKNGITHLTNSSVRLQLYAPNKDNVIVLGDFNDWMLQEDYQMTPSLDGNTYWLEIEGLNPGQPYAFQYLVDGTLKIADPYSTLVLDPSNDGFIPEETFPNIPPYPIGKTTGICTVFTPGATPFDWQTTNFTKPAKTDLVIYEVLMRDFLAKQNYQTLLDTLDYLERLGINAIEFMPVNEFEGNNSWGYNPSYHMALDKYYGTPEAFKTFIDEAHARGIAVIVDVVYNHAFSQSPFAQLYWDATNFRPTPENPWLNVEATHPFNVGYDFNHESQATKDFVKQVMEYWLTEYRIDGFRFDLSKGFTQTDYGDDVGAWGQYDAERIATLKRIADEMWAITPDAYVILEHFANNQEETELIDYGMMVWGNMNHNYNEASMGYSGNSLAGGIYTSRGWDKPHLITYMESHDEERLMYKNLEFGNSSGSYQVPFLETALQRQELVSAFFYTIPGPKMLWQFGELGYDFSINTCTNGTVNSNCRLDPKPIRWDYFEEEKRKRLYDVTRALIHLKRDYEVFRTTDFDHSVTNYRKVLHLNDPSMNVTVVGNFNVIGQSIDPNFQHTGMWYNYFSGDSLQVDDVNMQLNMRPGEYRLYTDQKLPVPPGGFQDFILDAEEATQILSALAIFPNPSRGTFTIDYALERSAQVEIELLNILGQKIQGIKSERHAAGVYQENLELSLAAGTYWLRFTVDGQQETKKIVIH